MSGRFFSHEIKGTMSLVMERVTIVFVVVVVGLLFPGRYTGCGSWEPLRMLFFKTWELFHR